MHFSTDPKDYLFTIYRSFDHGWCVAVVPTDYFEKEGHLCDQDLPLRIDGFAQITEGVFQGDLKLSTNDWYGTLTTKGFVFSKKFAKFVEEHDSEEVYYPAEDGHSAYRIKLAHMKHPENYRYFMLYTGYVESASIGCLLVSHKGAGFPTIKEGLDDFVASLKKAYLTDEEYRRNKVRTLSDCCKRTKAAVDDALFCAKCRGSLKTEIEVTTMDLREYLNKMIASTNDSSNYEVWEELQAMNWDVPGRPCFSNGPGRMVIIDDFIPSVENGAVWNEHVESASITFSELKNGNKNSYLDDEDQ